VKLTFHYANGFHTYSRREYPDFKPYDYPDLSGDDVGPEVAVETSLAQYLSGKDLSPGGVLTFDY
jgi:hypothetical protein